jgi:signal transduction histidine kinase
MKWKLTAQFLLFIILTIFLSLFAFLVLNMFFLYSNFGKSDRFIPYQSPSNYTLDFEKNIDFKNKEISIPADKLTQLEQGDMWIQVLDENGTELYSRFKPANVPVHYTPASLIHYHKYTGALQNSTIFVGMLEREDRKLSYIMGFPKDVIGKAYVYYRTETLLRDLFLIFSVTAIIVTFIALAFGYMFSHRLAKPLVKIIEGIQRLVKGDFSNIYTPKGIYKNVFQNLNELSSVLQSNEDERRKIERMREDWVTNITHDIKTPLASIKGYAELLQDKEYNIDDLERERYVEIILDKSDYIEHLIHDLNVTYQLQNPSFSVKKEEENVVEVLRESVIQILNHPLYEDTQLEFSAEIESYPFHCNKMLLQRAFMNLIFNAIVHNPPDTFIRIFIREDKGRAQIFIEDEGNGIAEEELENLFIRYYRGTNTGEAHKGSGLGLAIAKQIVEAHGGSIDVSSGVGKGTRVMIRL